MWRDQPFACTIGVRAPTGELFGLETDAHCWTERYDHGMAPGDTYNPDDGRTEALDRAATLSATLSLLFPGALYEPAHWHVAGERRHRLDSASKLDMEAAARDVPVGTTTLCRSLSAWHFKHSEPRPGQTLAATGHTIGSLATLEAAVEARLQALAPLCPTLYADVRKCRAVKVSCALASGAASAEALCLAARAARDMRSKDGARSTIERSESAVDVARTLCEHEWSALERIVVEVTDNCTAKRKLPPAHACKSGALRFSPEFIEHCASVATAWAYRGHAAPRPVQRWPRSDATDWRALLNVEEAVLRFSGVDATIIAPFSAGARSFCEKIYGCGEEADDAPTLEPAAATPPPQLEMLRAAARRLLTVVDKAAWSEADIEGEALAYVKANYMSCSPQQCIDGAAKRIMRLHECNAYAARFKAAVARLCGEPAVYVAFGGAAFGDAMVTAADRALAMRLTAAHEASHPELVGRRARAERDMAKRAVSEGLGDMCSAYRGTSASEIVARYNARNVAPAAPRQTLCGVCAAPGSMRCTRCKAAHYCSKACQAVAWPAHKLACTPSTLSTLSTRSAPCQG